MSVASGTGASKQSFSLATYIIQWS